MRRAEGIASDSVHRNPHRLARYLMMVVFGVVSFSASSTRALDFEALYASTQHDDALVPRVIWMGQGEEYLIERGETARERRWYRVRSADGQEQEWLNPRELRTPGREEEFECDRVEFSLDGHTALLATERERRWRRSHTARHWVLELPNGRLQELDADRTPQLHAAISPDGSHVAYVHAGNIYLKELENGEIRSLTHDGGADILNGDPSWLYEEELGYTTGLWWSPDGRSIAYLRSDLAEVGKYPLLFIGDADLPRVEFLPYAKSGAVNPRVDLGILELESGDTRWVRNYDQDAYLGRVEWLQDGRLLLQELDREQTTVVLSTLRPGENSPQLLLEERSAAWISARSDHLFLRDGSFLRVSARDGFAHVYLHAADGGSERQLTRGRWEVLELLAVDEAEGRLVVQTDRGDRAQRHLDAIAMLDGRVRRLSDSGGWHDASFDSSGRRYVETWSSLERRPELLLREADGSLLRVLHAPSMEDLAAESLGRVRFLEIPGVDGTELPARLLLPDDFDAARRYPVLLYCYGAPGSQHVRDRWGGKRELFHRILLQRGILILSVDNRGTRGRGEAFLHSVYRRLGQLEAEDQIAAAQWLSEQPYVDGAHIGIWGWSYGGYLSAMSILRGEDVFRCAASVSPVTDWALYDTIYTERFMGTPLENPEGYREGSLLTFAPRLRGSLFLLHGTSDDNVHIQNSLRLAAVLQEEGKPFEMMLYPDQNHSVQDGQRITHLMRGLMQYFQRHLLGPEAAGPPED